MERIEFTFHHGEVKIEAIGFKGSACEAATKDIREKLGATIEHTRKTEYYEKAAQKQSVESK